MQIQFKNIMPVPLATIIHAKDSVWGNEFVLTGGQKIMLNASSGKGKTTFTHTLAGIRKDFSGELLFDDRSILSFTPEEWATLRQKTVSVVFQDLQLFPQLSVKENILLKNKLTDRFSESEIKSFLDELEIMDKWEKKCGLLSMGQQQRVAIIRALCQPFEWLILDEPFSHLDVGNSSKSLQLIDRITTVNKAGIILTTLGDDYNYNYDKELKL